MKKAFFFDYEIKFVLSKLMAYKQICGILSVPVLKPSEPIHVTQSLN